MNSTTEYNLYQVWSKVASKTSINDADRIVEPIKYFIETGRCSGAFIRCFNKISARQISTIANRLIKFNGFDYDNAVKAVASYVCPECY